MKNKYQCKLTVFTRTGNKINEGEQLVMESCTFKEKEILEKLQSNCSNIYSVIVNSFQQV